MSEIAIAVTPLLSLPWWVFPNDELMITCFTCWLFGHMVTTLPVSAAVGTLLYYIFDNN
tara:strand:+ start:352 stop:528 length:177 start_codon:yes stop_codon:yes gene_type:complete